MTQEQKELLLKDVCARIPYKLVCEVKFRENGVYKTSNMVLDGIFRDDAYFISQNGTVYSSNYKPYLYPVSSMTEEQKKTLKVMCDWNDEEAYAQSILVLYQKHFVMKTDVIDWLNENHFDYRGLIERGLAIDATGLNIY